MKFFNVKSQEEAHRLLGEFASAYKLESEVIKTRNACGRIVDQEVLAVIDVPQFNRSTVDGYAVISRETHGATDSIPALMDLVGTIDMGKQVLGDIKAGQTMYIPTGGMLPESADGVVMIEDSESIDAVTVALMKSIAPGTSVIHRGDDIQVGAVAVCANKKLTSLDIGVLCAQGIDEVSVLKQPRVTIVSTGDEIIPIEESIALGQVYDINGNVLSQMVKESGGLVVKHCIVHDDYDSLYAAIDQATDESDLVILSGGSSVGTRDFTYDVIKALPESDVFIQGVGIKPGKPTIVGKGKGRLVVGLPGHPVSSIMVYKAFIDYYLRKLQGQAQKQADFVGQLTENVHSAPGKTTYQMVTVTGEATQLKVCPLYGKSGMISLLAKANGYIIIEAHQEGLEVGSLVMGYNLR